MAHVLRKAGGIIKGEVSGNYVVTQDMLEIPLICKYVSNYMSHIKIIVLGDFTHFISAKVGQMDFQTDKKKGGGYEKYVRLAVESLHTFFSTTFHSILRDDMFLITEFHVEKREGKDVGGIFVPQGGMLKGTFLPESYFDQLYGTRVIRKDEDPDLKKAERYKIVTQQTDELPYVRDMGLFPNDEEIPNDLSLIIEKNRGMVGIKVMLEEGAKELYKKHKPDAGWDLYAISKEAKTIDHGKLWTVDGSYEYDNKSKYIEYGTGVHVSIPEGYVGLIFPRSSIYKKQLSLSNSVGVIDSGYIGEIRFKFNSEGLEYYEVGDRIGQIIFMKLPDVQLEYVDSLEETARGEGGFGSTGA